MVIVNTFQDTDRWGSRMINRRLDGRPSKSWQVVYFVEVDQSRDFRFPGVACAKCWIADATFETVSSQDHILLSDQLERYHHGYQKTS